MLARTVLAAALLASSGVVAAAASTHLNGTYKATAYAQKGLTASGQPVHMHVVAADPDILPIGTRIRIKHAGRYSGEYVVADTGDKIQGRRLDIYLPSTVACKKFGVKAVKVNVIQLGDGTKQAAKQADTVVKQEVKQDVAKGVVGRAATDVDFRAHEAEAAADTNSTAAPKPAQASSPGAKKQH